MKCSAQVSAGLESQRGFVLPSVLAYITAALAIVSIGALALERAQDSALNLQTQVQLTRALDEAEAQLAFHFLTSRSVPNGVSTVPEGFDAVGALLGDEVERDQVGDVWRADGELRRMQVSNSNILVAYKDVGGLISLNSSRSDLIEALLQSFGVSPEEAMTLVARLKDFTDEDSLRRPRGAERADYRMRGMSAPSNSALRTVSEAAKVLGWADLKLLSDPSFLSSVTVSLTPSEPRRIFAGDELKDLLDDHEGSLMADRDVIDEAMGASLLPAGRARFSIIAYDEHSLQSVLRIIELERNVASLTSPYSRALIYEGPERRTPSVLTLWAEAKELPPVNLEVADEGE